MPVILTIIVGGLIWAILFQLPNSFGVGKILKKRHIFAIYEKCVVLFIMNFVICGTFNGI